MAEEVVVQRRLQRGPLLERWASVLGVWGLRFFLRLPRGALLLLLILAKRLAMLSGAEQTPAIDDLHQILRHDPEASRVLRRMVVDSRAAELRMLIRGVLRHQMGGAPYHVVIPHRRKRPTTHTHSGELRIGVVGAGLDASAMRSAYGTLGGCRVVDVPLGGEPPADISALEIEGLPGAQAVAETALGRGVAVSIAHSAISDRTAFERLSATADANGVALRILYPYLYYPPVQRLLYLLAAGELGEISSIRVRGMLARGGGDRDSPSSPGEDYLAHPAFDHFPLLVALGGAITGVAAYGNTMSMAAGQALVSCRFDSPARYGLLELTRAPEFRVRSEHHPFDLEAEIAGTHGIIWLRRGMAQRTLGAPLSVRVGRSAYTLGVESGLRSEWRQVFGLAAADWCDTLRSGEQPRLTRENFAAAFAARDLSRAALRTPGVVEL